ncbi:MAG: glycosyltransferase family 2 protein [Fulvivirga sp.]|uniref:glycosyltransferase family 2 protein n=1 Tax=Fulvivirga sp. TaxID=1931237 RepID=UPI0032F06E7C
MISVITPFYNAEQYLSEAIQSVLNQEYHDFELLLVNDGSTDGSKDIALSFCDERIKYFEQSNGGVSKARNLGLKNMSGNYFCFLDSDDLMTRKSLSSRLEKFNKQPSLAFVGGAQEQRKLSSDTPLIQYPSYAGNPRRGLVTLNSTCFINCGTWLIKRDKMREYSFPEGWTHSEDLVFFLMISDQGVLDYTREIVQIYRRHNESAMANLSQLENSYWRFYDFVKTNKYHSGALELLELNLKIRKIMSLSYLEVGNISSGLSTLFRMSY